MNMERDKDREKDQERDQERDHNRDKGRCRDRDREKGKDRDKERDRDHDKNKDKERRRKRSRTKSHDRNEDGHRQRSKRDRSESASRSRSRDRTRKHRDRERDRSRSTDRKDRRDKDRHREDRRDKDRTRDRDRDRDRDDRRDRDKERGERKDNETVRTAQAELEMSATEKLPALPLTEDELKAQREREKEAEINALEEEMRRRREKVRLWQEARAAQQAPQAVGESKESDVPDAREDAEGLGFDREGGEDDDEEEGEKPRWTLEDDEEEEAAAVAAVSFEAPEEILAPPVLLHPLRGDANEEEVFKVKAKPSSAPVAPTVRDEDKEKRLSRLARWQESKALKAAAVLPPQLLSVPPPPPTPAPDPVEDEDPLDAFMSDLLSSGAVAEQKALKAVESDTVQKQPLLVPPNPIVDEDLDSGINFNGSNTITLDEILGRRPWDNDTGNNSPVPTAAASHYDVMDIEESEDAEKQERERQEFMAAIRKAREDEERARERLLKMDEELSRQRRDDQGLGRVFGGEGDVADEAEVLQRKRSALELLEEAKRGKTLKEVDHSKIEYLPFRKNLYIVPKALAKLSEDELVAKRDLLQIKVRGRGCPAPVDTWEQCGLPDRVLQCIYAHGLAAPFAIQKQAIPAIMCGRDAIGVAKTGSGKTLAFLLPMFRHIQDQPPLLDSEGPIGLVMAPARELAFQIYNEAKKFTKALGMRVACIYGGAGVAEQIADLRRGSEIVVCTPGRMIDILTMQAGKLVALKRVTVVVLDEADRMFDMGFEPQIKMILQNVRPDRQTVLFSATFPKPIEKLARQILKLPLEIIVGERSSVNKDITQHLEVHEEEDKFLRLLQLLGVWYDKGSVLVFVDKQEKCDQLFHELLKLGYPCLSLHGGKDQVDRDHALHEFKTGVKTVMIATSVAGRGLDVPEIVCVINFNCPNHLEDYVHRVGRTGRAGRKGTAYTFISPKEDQYAPAMAKALQRTGHPVPAELEALARAFKEKVDRGEAHYVGSGFVGKGFTFDAAEMNESQKVVHAQRRAYEAEQGLLAIEDGAEDEEEDEEARAAKPAAAPGHPSAGSGASAAASVDAQTAVLRARLLAQQFTIKRSEDPSRDYFMEELEINDYPVQVRRKVAARQALEEMCEQGVTVTSRGTYVAAGKKADLGERPLYLLIEGNNEMSVRQTRMEVQRRMEEETLKLSAMGTGQGSSGRYSVV